MYDRGNLQCRGLVDWYYPVHLLSCSQDFATILRRGSILLAHPFKVSSFPVQPSFSPRTPVDEFPASPHSRVVIAIASTYNAADKRTLSEHFLKDGTFDRNIALSTCQDTVHVNIYPPAPRIPAEYLAPFPTLMKSRVGLH
jgi:hypothetical protein